ncbi:HlyIII-domain-containing protein [Aureobasidium pullulans]|uniref:HlyIII-domain-containing protein n=1 Tax=Aureobasidium pullulans TaxID=5580 RepID=A0A4T0B7U4_AURPU|nr:HlyIII-domain-containing protein [Aureobasidium pullulans]
MDLRSQINHRKPTTRSGQDQDKRSEKDIITKVEREVSNALTVLWSEIDPWQQDNHYIHSGYRPASNSFSRSFASLSYIHNETVNIYTHLLGAVAALICSVYLHSLIRPRYDRATAEDVIVFGCFFGGAVACLGMSATYHAISNHSPKVSKIGNQLDYVGIVCLIWGSFIPSIFYGFAREPGYIAITLIGIGCATVSILPSFRTPKWRPFRAGMFVAMGLSAVIPVLHGISLFGVEQLQRQMGLSWLVLQGVLYVSGAAIYAARVPERLKPGSFDIWGSSHQIFHVLVLLAAASHFIGLVKSFDYEHSARAQADNVVYGFNHIFSKN